MGCLGAYVGSFGRVTLIVGSVIGLSLPGVAFAQGQRGHSRSIAIDPAREISIVKERPGIIDREPGETIDEVVAAVEELYTILLRYGIPERVVTYACRQTQAPEVCRILLGDLVATLRHFHKVGFDRGYYATLLQRDISAYLRSQVNTLYQTTSRVNLGMRTLLLTNRSWLLNRLGENRGSSALLRDIQELDAKMARYRELHEALIHAIPALREAEDPRTALRDFLSLFPEYARTLFSLFRNYPEYLLHLDATLHFLGNDNDLRELAVHEAFARDFETVIGLGERYVGLDTSTLIPLLQGEEGLYAKIREAYPPLSLSAESWFALFGMEEPADLHGSARTVEQAQRMANGAMREIYGLEAEIAREVCRLHNPENPGKCDDHYPVGTGLEALRNRENPVAAICAERTETEDCLRRTEIFRMALSATLESEDPSFRLLLRNLAELRMSPEDFEAFMAVADAFAEAVGDGDGLTVEEFQEIGRALAGLFLTSDLMDRLLSGICKNAPNETCGDALRNLAATLIDLRQGNLSVQEAFLQGVAKVLFILRFGDTLAVLNTMEDVETKIWYSLIANDATRGFLANRAFEAFLPPLEADYAHIAEKLADLQAIHAELSAVAEEMFAIDAALDDPTTTPEEREELEARMAELKRAEKGLRRSYHDAMIELEAYYLHRYLPNMFAGGNLVLNTQIGRALDRTDIHALSLYDLFRYLAQNDPGGDWQPFLANVVTIQEISASARTLLEEVDHLHGEILEARDPAEAFLETDAKQVQEALDHEMKKLIVAKINLLVKIYFKLEAFLDAHREDTEGGGLPTLPEELPPLPFDPSQLPLP
ncbi:MAG: hypothetical protein D6795_09045 [Deltaproteobacteria bacterium]|nr:MAG: hypothetical protein D6795_09045 [Deltaproteobacteria bacterium]